MDRFFELDKNSFSRYLGRCVCLLIEVTHSAFAEPFYLTNNREDVTANSKTYTAYPFDVILPSQTEQDGTQIVLSNINNLISNEIAKIGNSNENMVLKLYVASVESNSVDTSFKGEFEINTPTITNEAVTANINIRNCLDINIGSIRYNKTNFPNLSLI